MAKHTSSPHVTVAVLAIDMEREDFVTCLPNLFPVGMPSLSTLDGIPGLADANTIGINRDTIMGSLILDFR